jgi:hypothetical protein
VRPQQDLTTQTLSKLAILRYPLCLFAIRECDNKGMAAREVSEGRRFSRQRAAKSITEARWLPSDR